MSSLINDSLITVGGLHVFLVPNEEDLNDSQSSSQAKENTRSAIAKQVLLDEQTLRARMQKGVSLDVSHNNLIARVKKVSCAKRNRYPVTQFLDFIEKITCMKRSNFAHRPLQHVLLAQSQ